MAFAHYGQIDYDSLKTAWRSGRLSSELEQMLSQVAGFDTTDPTWIDENVDPSIRTTTDNDAYPGRDTASNFRAMLRRHHGLSGSGTFVRVVNERPQLVDRNLAAFSIEDSGQGGALGEPMPMFLTVVLEKGYHPQGIEFGFRRVRFRFAFDDESLTRAKQRLGQPMAIQLNGAVLEVRGGEHNPEWFIHVDESVLEGEYASRDFPLCVLHEARLGEEFSGEISVRPMDGSLVAIAGKPLEDIQKKRIIELLCSKRLPGAPDSQGWISLGRQRLRVVRADRA
jgi:hypothetical protein